MPDMGPGSYKPLKRSHKAYYKASRGLIVQAPNRFSELLYGRCFYNEPEGLQDAFKIAFEKHLKDVNHGVPKLLEAIQRLSKNLQKAS